MATYTLYPDTSKDNGHIFASGTSYPPTTLAAYGNNTVSGGHQQITAGSYNVYQGFISFDLASAGLAGKTITSASLSLYSTQDPVSFNEERLYSYSWTTPLTTSDWRSQAQCGALSLLSSATTLGLAFGTIDYLVFDGSTLTSHCETNKAGSIDLLIVSTAYVLNTPPGVGAGNSTIFHTQTESGSPKSYLTIITESDSSSSAISFGSNF